MLVDRFPKTWSSRLTTALRRARSYVQSRQCVNGGYSFYRSEYLEEPNLHDTWHALAALRLLGTLPLRAQETADFVTAQSLWGPPYGLYFRVLSLSLLGHPEPERATVRASVAALPIDPPVEDPPEALLARLERLRMTLELKRHFSLEVPKTHIAQRVLALQRPGGGFGDTPNLHDTRLALAVLQACDHPTTALTATRDFVAGLAAPECGFKLTTDSLLPTLPTTCAGIHSCRWLGLAVPHPEHSANYILGCQSADGGFARAAAGLPNLDLTHQALAGLDALVGPLSQ